MREKIGGEIRDGNGARLRLHALRDESTLRFNVAMGKSAVVLVVRHRCATALFVTSLGCWRWTRSGRGVVVDRGEKPEIRAESLG